MAVEFTDSQKEAIKTTGRNILVSAAAGSGKTAVLTERIVKKVCDEKHPVDIDKLLVVTFTRAAAAEMRARIAARIEEELKEHPESEHIQRQATLIYNAQITTIDSFCQFLLKNHFNEIGLDPAFRVMDEGEIKMLLKDTMDEMLEEYYDEGTEEFHECLEFFCPGGRDSVLEEYIISLYNASRAEPWPMEWLQNRRNDYRAASLAEFSETETGKYLASYIRKMFYGWSLDLANLTRLSEEPDGPYMYGANLEKDAEILERLSGLSSLEDMAREFGTVKFSTLSSKADPSVNPDKREYVKNARSEIKEAVQALGKAIFTTPLNLAMEQANSCSKPLNTLLDLVLDFTERVDAKKQEKRMIDFADMEHFALDILVDKKDGVPVPSDVAREYRNYFEEILIDEYQDSNRVQETLLAAVCGEELGKYNRFMVGDIKQSIYRFRLARPELFKEKYESYSEGRENCARIDLSSNFRSRSQVVDSVNQVFSRLMSKDTGGIEYDAAAALYAMATYPENEGCETELLLVEGESEEDGDAKQQEARAVAARIIELKKNFRVTTKDGTTRPLNYSDIVILFRTNKGWDEVFKKELEARNIPVFITSKAGYFQATEVQLILSFLRVVDNPLQDIPLYGVLNSIFGGFCEEEIAKLHAAGKDEEALYHLVKRAAAGEIVPECREKAQQFLEMLAEFRNAQNYLPIRELLTKIILRFDYLNYVSALPAGSRRKANVEMLYTRAAEFEKTSYFGLFHFLRYIEQLEARDVDYGEAEVLDENADVVRVMSIHKSKGLEFPVTFVCGLSKKFNTMDMNKALVIDSDLGIGATFCDSTKRMKNSTLQRYTIIQKMKEESIAEEIRVLYVAMTRAREKLILTGAVKGAEKVLEAANNAKTERLTFPAFMKAGGYLSFLLPILKYTDIQVKTVGGEEMTAGEITKEIARLDRREKLLLPADGEVAEAAEKLRKKLNAPYRFAYLEGLFTKTTVSELKIAAMADRDEAAYHTFEDKEVVPYIPSFRKQEEKAGGTERGNAYHRCMELLDFKVIFGKLPDSYEAYKTIAESAETEERLDDFLTAEVTEERLPAEYKELVSLRKIKHFLATEIGYRMARADSCGRLYREQPFVLGVNASRLKEQFTDEECVLVQGIIDVFFEEEDGIVLLDYKTDSVQSMEQLWGRYETQLDYYSEAIERLRDKKVKERYLYSFNLEKY